MDNNLYSKYDFIDKSVLLGLRLDGIGKKRKISGSMIDNLDSVSGMIHVHKDILNCPELNAIALVDSQIRAYIRKNTFPTDFGNGVYILPIQMFEEVDSTLTELKKDRDVLIEKFKDMYDQRKLEAETRLGRFYEEKDYPSIEKLNACFDFRIQYLSFDVPKNLKNIRSEIYERELEKVDKMWLRTLEIIKTSLYSDFGKLLEHLKERLAPDSNGKAKKFKEATLLNLIDFTQTFDKKNIICDPKLAKIVNDLRLQIINLDSKSLRDNEKIRGITLNHLQAALSEMQDDNKSITTRIISFE